MTSAGISRRRFISATTVLVSCSSLIGGLESCRIGSLLYSSGDIPLAAGTAELFLEKEPDLHSIGGAVKKRFAMVNDGNIILVVRNGEHSFAAYAAQCTHWGAEVGFPDNGVLVCPFHGSRFSSDDGSVLHGPAAQPLQQFPVTFNESLQRLTVGSEK